MSDWSVVQGDCLDVLRTMPDESVQCCVTSPPYYGLRDYGVDGQIGLEPTPADYVERMVEVFREVRRVLKSDGTLWLNIGDSYAAQRGGSPMPAETLAGGVSGKGDTVAKRGRESAYLPHRNAASLGLKHKDLIGIPWMLAFALRLDGWWLRQDIIWHKPNPMPESVRDRCTKAHEHIFLLAKSEVYEYDADAISEPSGGWKDSEFHTGKTGVHQLGRSQKVRPPGNKTHRGADAYAQGDGRHRTKAGLVKYAEKSRNGGGEWRNRRSVWTIPTRPFSEAHFATMPPDLARLCILAGSRVGDVVFDPFTGSGTTGVVAVQDGRGFVGAELNPEYCEMARRRIGAAAEQIGLFHGGGE